MTGAHNNLRNVGIFAHVDAGKMTTTEQMLFLSGHIRFARQCQYGYDAERFARCGTDFLSEVERLLRVMDGAVLTCFSADFIILVTYG